MLTSLLATATSEAVAAEPTGPLDRLAWVVTVDSEHDPRHQYGYSAIDGRPETMWHTPHNGSPGLPHWIKVDLGKSAEVDGIRYLGRQEGVNGRIGDYRVYVSETPADWTTLAPVATGTFPDTSVEQEVRFPRTTGRYVTLVALSEAGNRGQWTTVAEFNVLGVSRDVLVQAVSGVIVDWAPVTDGLTDPSCSLLSGPASPRAWIAADCAVGRFDTADLSSGVHTFDYQVGDRTGTVRITVRPPLQVYDTLWTLPSKANPDQVEQYFTHLENEGFAGTWISLYPFTWQGGLTTPNYAGHAIESFDTPNEQYLQHVDYILDRAAAHGRKVSIAVAWATDYVGSRPGAVAVDPDIGPAPIDETNARAFGQLIGGRWKDHPALDVWVMGGDWWTPETEAETEPVWVELVAGLRDAGATQPATYQTGGYRASWMVFADRSWVDFLAPHTGHCVEADLAQGALASLASQYGKETVSSEMRYEAETAGFCSPQFLVTPAMMEADAHAAFQGGAEAYLFGHKQRWSFETALASLGSPGEVLALDVARDGISGDDSLAPTWSAGSTPSGSSTASSITLTWPAATDGTGVAMYRVRSNTGILARTGSTGVTLTGLTPATDYTLWVEAVDFHGNVASGSNVVVATEDGSATTTTVPTTTTTSSTTLPPTTTTTLLPPPEPEGDQAVMFDPDRGRWHLRAGDGSVDSFYYGVPGDVPLFGDWDCDGIDTVAMYRPSNGFVYLRNSNDFGVADEDFFYGLAGDVPLAGDWDGDGCDTLGIYRPSEAQAYVANSLGTVIADTSFFFGIPGDVPFGADFDGVGGSTIGLRRETSGFVYIRQSLTTGFADEQFFYGIPGDRVVLGDWDGDGDETVAIYRPGDGRWYLSNRNAQGGADRAIDFGEPGWLPLAGDF